MELDTIPMADIPLLVVPFSSTPSKLHHVLQRLCLEDATVCQIVSATFRAQAVRAIYANHINPSNRFILCLGEGVWSRCYLGDEYITHFGNFSSDSLASPTYSLSRMLFSQHPPPITITKRSLDTFMRSLGDLQLELAHHRVNAHATSSLKIASIEFYVSDSYAACATSLATLNCATVLRDVFSRAHKTLRFLSVCCYGQSSMPAFNYMRLQLETINEALSNRRQNFPVLREIIMPSEFMSGLMTPRTVRRLAKTLEVLDMTLCPSNLVAGFLAKVPRVGGSTDAVTKLSEYVIYERVHTLRIRDGYYKPDFHGIDLYVGHQLSIRAAVHQSLPNLRHVIVQRCLRKNAEQAPLPLLADATRSQLHIIWSATYTDALFIGRRGGGAGKIVPTIHNCDFMLYPEGVCITTNLCMNLPRELAALCRQVTIDTLSTARLLSSSTTTLPTLATASRIAYTKYFAPLHDLHCRSSLSSEPMIDDEINKHTKLKRRPRFTVRFQLSPHQIHHPYDEVTEWLNMFQLQCTCKQEPYLQKRLQREQAAAAFAVATVPEEAHVVVQEQEPPVNEQRALAAGGRNTLNSTGRRRCNEQQDETETKPKKLAAESAANVVLNPYALSLKYSADVVPCRLQISQLHIKTAVVTIQNYTTLDNYRKQILAAILTALAGLPSSACVVSKSNWVRTDSCTIGGRAFRLPTAAERGRSQRSKVKNIYFSPSSTRGADLADPLLYVRHIRLQCSVTIATPTFCSVPAIASPDETSYYSSETDFMQDSLPERRFRTEDDDTTSGDANNKTTLPYLLFELISAKFRREHVAPLVRLIARRFVRLRHFTIMCDNVHSSRKVTYNLDDIVMEERVTAVSRRLIEKESD